GIRADVDNRNESVGKRIAKAETDWVPYYVVIGDDELGDDQLGVNIRAEGTEIDATPGELQAIVAEDVGDLPSPRRYLPRHVSDHPHFTGR
ncbi:MAG: His/Gly/Thr/Pro-type tRNA ligase C-terminal domain-containing protein, partial [Haloplanus sp.]